ncbi:snRNA-activating protein complex subunit 3 [Smittium culicis]|uniref:snRNA-activating protein complex subunit 3 n=1 Tax=Smittium culicis TaxID=133412 RepID=A0A1R1YBB8_9FUNG|nr:snRNA-activating protein complex subunit 3 [Smittium culicis]OMJ24145.1 snRNA-activating protein complex subunit 3 [Smittium culicis]
MGDRNPNYLPINISEFESLTKEHVKKPLATGFFSAQRSWPQERKDLVASRYFEISSIIFSNPVLFSSLKEISDEIDDADKFDPNNSTASHKNNDSPSQSYSSNFENSVFNPRNINSLAKNNQILESSNLSIPNQSKILDAKSKITDLETKFRKIGKMLKTSKLKTLSKNLSEFDYPLKYRPAFNFLVGKPSQSNNKPKLRYTKDNLISKSKLCAPVPTSFNYSSGLYSKPNSSSNKIQNNPTDQISPIPESEANFNLQKVVPPPLPPFTSNFATDIFISFTWPLQYTKGIYSIIDKFGNFKPNTKNKLASYKVKSSVYLSDLAKSFKCIASKKRPAHKHALTSNHENSQRDEACESDRSNSGLSFFVFDNLVYYDDTKQNSSRSLVARQNHSNGKVYGSGEYEGSSDGDIGWYGNGYTPSANSLQPLCQRSAGSVPSSFRSSYYEHIFKQPAAKSTSQYEFIKMRSCKLSGLGALSLGQPYLFVHNDECEHLVYFDEIVYSPASSHVPSSSAVAESDSGLASGGGNEASAGRGGIMQLPSDYINAMSANSEQLNGSGRLEQEEASNAQNSIIDFNEAISEINAVVESYRSTNIRMSNSGSVGDGSGGGDGDGSISAGCADKGIEQTFSARFIHKRCRMCLVYAADFVTRNDFHSGETPCFFCRTCYRNFHYDKNNKLLLDHKVYPYF